MFDFMAKNQLPVVWGLRPTRWAFAPKLTALALRLYASGHCHDPAALVPSLFYSIQSCVAQLYGSMTARMADRT